ncbi:hypothetical protein PV327_002192 [Microctonus hyperodae]|uniref:Uncharacterized protein n=1 Tax=Microctonus hyperodae TaxID=165561 RepID=A0AA39KP26_MICHY|nr:hypothetical protein PV327_002192 [Microctonus hyperodae]
MRVEVHRSKEILWYSVRLASADDSFRRYGQVPSCNGLGWTGPQTVGLYSQRIKRRSIRMRRKRRKNKRDHDECKRRKDKEMAMERKPGNL